MAILRTRGRGELNSKACQAFAHQGLLQTTQIAVSTKAKRECLPGVLPILEPNVISRALSSPCAPAHAPAPCPAPRQVRHPGVSALMQCDFELMQRAARLASLLPGLSELRLDESLRQFGGPLKEQVRGLGQYSL